MSDISLGDIEIADQQLEPIDKTDFKLQINNLTTNYNLRIDRWKPRYNQQKFKNYGVSLQFGGVPHSIPPRQSKEVSGSITTDSDKPNSDFPEKFTVEIEIDYCLTPIDEEGKEICETRKTLPATFEVSKD